MILFTRYKLHHILFWVAYFVFWCFFSMRQYHTPFPYALLYTFVWFIAQGGLAYACIYFLIPVFLTPRRYGLFAAWLLAIILAGAALVTATAVVFRSGQSAYTLSFATFFFYVMLNNFFLAGLAISVGLIRERIKTERRNRRLEKERTENELRFLKSQVNPHFLFNAINSIYVLIKKDPTVAAATLARFADMLRYQLYECNVDAIPIEKELAYLENYVKLEKIRKGESADTVFSVGEQVRHFSIAPLLLIPFVENAFKHLAPAKDGNGWVRIDMDYAAGIFRLGVQNTAGPETAPPEEKGYGGIGLENVRRRLELIYPNRHSLQIQTDNNVYSVALQVKITG